MKTATFPLCSKCNAAITTPGGGFIVHGTIRATPTQAGPILAGEGADPLAFCRRCFCAALGISETTVRDEKRGPWIDPNIRFRGGVGD